MPRVEQWLFAPGDPRQLAALRIGLCSLLAVRLSRPLYLGLAGQPRELFRPISFMHLLPSMPSRTVTLALQILGVAAAVLAAVGLRARATLPVAWACALLLNGMATSTGKVVHNDVLLLLALVPLLPAPASDAWSFDGRGRPLPSPSVRYGWPVRTAMVVVAGTYFFSGLAKVVFSGPAWMTGGNLRWVLYTASDGRAQPVGLALFVADRPWLAHVLAATTLGIELGFPLVLWRPGLAWVFVPAAAALHLGIWATLHLDYSAWALTAIVVFVPWTALRPATRRLPSRGRSGSVRPPPA
jgi:hypothetical protein